jgi:hypothetical protein
MYANIPHRSLSRHYDAGEAGLAAAMLPSSNLVFPHTGNSLSLAAGCTSEVMIEMPSPVIFWGGMIVPSILKVAQVSGNFRI